HSLSSHAIQLRRLDDLLTVASQIAVSEVVGQYENDIRQLVGCGSFGPTRTQCAGHDPRNDGQSNSRFHGVIPLGAWSSFKSGSTAAHAVKTGTISDHAITWTARPRQSLVRITAGLRSGFGPGLFYLQAARPL